MTTHNFEAWEDIDIFPIVTSNTMYKIEIDGGETIFVGTVLTGQKLEYINEITAQYIKVNFPEIYTHTFTSNSTVCFNVYTKNLIESEWILEYQINITYNWSYNYRPTGVISDPIAHILDYRQFMMYSTLYPTDHQIIAHIKDIEPAFLNYTSQANQLTTTFYNLTTISYPGEFNYDYSDDFYIEDIIPPNRDYTIIINNEQFHVVHSCKNYALYYINAYGGFDTLLIQGKGLKTDTITNSRYTKYNKFALGWHNQDFGTINYKKRIKESWELTTHPLSDIQSSKIKHLIESNCVYLHSFDDNQITPVNISTTNIEYKTYRNQNRKFPIYTFNAESAQTKYRYN